MTPLPPPLGTGELVFWRLDEERFAPTWASGEGSFRVGGRWNGRGQRVVYASLDPSTAILEVAVHKGFRVLDTRLHVLTRARVIDPARVRMVQPADVPNPHWLHPGQPSAGQREFGAGLLAAHAFVALPSAVSAFSWNLVFDPSQAEGLYDCVEQTRFALDPRLHPDLDETDMLRCIVPERGVTADTSLGDELWARFFTAAPARRRRFVERYSFVKRA